MSDQLPGRISGLADDTGGIVDWDGGKPRGAPTQEDVYRDECSAILPESLAQRRTEGAKATDALRHIDTHGPLECKLCGPRREVAPQTMTLPFRKTIDHIVALGELFQKPRYFLGRILKIVIHRDDRVESRVSNAAQLGILLSKVAGQMDPYHPIMLLAGTVNDLAAAIVACIIHQNNLVFAGNRWEQRSQALQKNRQAAFRVIDGNNDRERFCHGSSSAARAVVHRFLPKNGVLTSDGKILQFSFERTCFVKPPFRQIKKVL